HRQRKHWAVHPRTQCRPTAPVPSGDVIGRAAARRCEIAPRIHVAARHRQRIHRGDTPPPPRTPPRPPPPVPPAAPLCSASAPAHTSPPDTASAYTVLFIPEPSAVQLLPSHLAIPLTVTATPPLLVAVLK